MNVSRETFYIGEIMSVFVPESLTLDTVLTIGDWSNSRLNYKTLADVISDVASMGYNSFITPIGSYDYGGVHYDGYYSIIAFNLPDQTDYHIAYGTYLNPNNPTAAGFQVVGSLGFHNLVYYYGTMTERPDGYTKPTKTVDNIYYYYFENSASQTGTKVIVYTGADIETLYINGVVPITYTWKPFEQLVGNNGQFMMNLSKIDESIIGDGSTQTGTNDITKLYLNPVTSLYNLTVNMLDDTETVIVYCGRNYLTLTRETIEQTNDIFIKVTIKLYFMSDVLVYQASPIAFNINDSKKWYLSIIYDNENQSAALDLIEDRGSSANPRYYYNNFALPSAQDLYEIWVWLQDNGNEQEYLNPYDTGTTDDGGDPDLPRPQDHIGKPTLPTTGGLDRGIITLYRPTPEQLSSISDFLWSDNVLDNFKKYFNNFADNILSLYSLPFKPAGLPTKTFKVGKMTSEITNVEYCTVRFFEIDMGEVVLRKKWGSYLDYAPYTKIEIYLPALGLHSLDTDELMSPADMYGNMPSEQGTVLKLTYNLDILTGVVVALLSVRVKKGNTYTDEVRYQFSGKIGHDVPLTGQVFANRISAIVQATAGLIGTIASGGLTAPISVPAAVTATVQAQKANVLRIGNISADASAMCTEVPYIIITSPNKALLENQEDFTGFPSYKSGTLQNFTGFTQVLDAHVEGISCTEEERSLILTMLKEGVLI